MIYGYARCSTNESQQDITRQKRELKALGATDKTIFFEYASGAKTDRIELAKLLDTVTVGDCIVTTEVSRITRSTKHLCDLIEVVKEKKIKLVIKDSLTIDCSNGEIDPMTKAFITISGVFAELERDITTQRIKSGLSNARAKAEAEGRSINKPKTTVEDIPQSFIKYYKQWKRELINKTELAKLTGFTRPTVNKYIRILEAGEGTK